jgi:asparagine synthase (glutamine-hydrolysing)
VLLLTVAAPSAGTPALKPGDVSTHSFDFGELKVTVTSSDRFGFWREIDGRIVVGEAAVRLDDGDASRLEEAARDPASLGSLLGDRFLLLAVVDPQEQTATIAHAMGSWRSYYVATGPHRLTLSTSLKGLRRAGHPVAWNANCTPEYLTFRFVTPPRSVSRGIRKLVDGQLLRVDLRDGGVRELHRWRWPEYDGEETPHSLLRSLRQQVETWLAAFPRVGILLSGGVDSSLLAALARLTRPDVPTFSSSFAFADPDDAESSYATSMARHLGVAHEVHHVTPERYLAGWVESIDAAEEPVYHLQSVLLHCLFRDREASAHGAILTGEGADSLFGNVAHSFLHRYRRAIGVLRATGAGVALAPLAERVPRLGRFGSLLTRRYDRQISSRHHFLWTRGRQGANIVRRVLRCDDAALIGERPTLVQPYLHRPLLDQVTALSLQGGVQATNSVWARLAESTGVRLGFPYMAPSVLTTALSVPWSVRLKESKHLARAALRELGIPEPLISRPKLSFGLPTRCWAPPGALFQPVVDMAKRAHDPSLLESLQTPEYGSSMVLWAILNQFLWTEIFETGRSVDDLVAEIVDRRRQQRG